MARSPFLFDTHDLPHRAGEIREYDLDITDHGSMGFDVLAIPSEEPIEVDLTIQSVAEGVLATGEVHTIAEGECSRCLDPVEFELDESFQELFEYEKNQKSDKKNRDKSRGTQEFEEDGEDEIRYMDGDLIDLEGPIRDALILNLPINPLCDEECPGLCPECGEKWRDLPEGHAHQKSDIRWAGLEGWKPE